MRTIAIAAAGIAILGGIVFLLSAETRPLRISIPSPTSGAAVLASPHVAGDEKMSLERIKLSVVYFVPRDRQELIKKDWADVIKKPLEEMRAFHRLQFHGRSELVYTVLPDPVIGEKNAAVYDGTDTNRGNPHAWTMIRDELNGRLGEIRDDDVGGGSFVVRLVLYEGVGALGGERQILVSSGYLKTDYTASVFSHELGHTFGLEDAYDYTSGAPQEEDVMGLGRQKPIGQVYLSEKAKQQLGIL